MFFLTLLLVYSISVLLIRGWTFAMFHRDGITDSFEWEHDLEFASHIALFAGLLGPVGVFLFWLITDQAKHGWTLRPDKV